ncbi:MAG: glycosyltransferase family 4 protein, partial [Limnochordales bacterium]
MFGQVDESSVRGGQTEVRREILMLAWEYPPKVVGGLARHAAYLSRALAAQGHRVVVLTQEAAGAPAFEDDAGVEVHRLPVHGPPPRDFVGWVKRLNFQMVERAVHLFASGRRFDIVHA